MDYETTYKFTTDVSYLFRKKIFERYCKDKKVLDIGCAQGEYLKYFNSKSLGLDLSPKNLDAAKNKGLRVQKFDFNSPVNLNETFEIIFASHVLEHVENPISLLRFCNKHLDKNGKLIISVPNEISFIHLKYPYFTEDGNHLYSFSVTNMKELLKHTNFNIEEIMYDYYNALSNKLKINPILGVLDKTPWIIKTPFAWAYWFIATKN